MAGCCGSRALLGVNKIHGTKYWHCYQPHDEIKRECVCCRMVVVRWLLVDVINEFSVDTEFHNERVVALL